MRFKSIEDPSLDDFLKLKTFKPDFVSNKYLIVIAGLGGTGGYVIRDLARFVYSVQKRTTDFEIEILCVDPDNVEEKNLLRQNFMPNDLGKNKAEVMASRHSKAFGIPIMSSNEYVDFRFLKNLRDKYRDYNIIIVGCVDNNKARREISDFMRYYNGDNNDREGIYWIDSGNERMSGQIILGGEGLPTTTDLFPEILDEQMDTPSEISCAERLMRDEQNIFVNTTAATHVLNLIRSVVLKEELMIHGVKFNISGKVSNFCLAS